MSIKIHKYLKRAELADLFTANENVIENNALFYQSQLDGKFYGAYFTHRNTDHCELYVKYTIGMVYVLNFETPGSDDISIKLELSPAEVYDIKDGPKHLKYRKSYYKKVDFSMEGPFFLSPQSNPEKLKILLHENQMYIIKENQKIELLTNQKIAV